MYKQIINNNNKHNKVVSHSKKNPKEYHLKTQLKWEYVTNWLDCEARNFSKRFQGITKPLYINIVESQYLLSKPRSKEGSWTLENHKNLMRDKILIKRSVLNLRATVGSFTSTRVQLEVGLQHVLNRIVRRYTWMNLDTTTAAPGKKDWWLKLTKS